METTTGKTIIRTNEKSMKGIEEILKLSNKDFLQFFRLFNCCHNAQCLSRTSCEECFKIWKAYKKRGLLYR